MAVRTQRDQVVEIVFFAFLPRDDVVDINLSILAGVNRTPMTCFNEHPAGNVGWNWRSIGHMRDV